MRLRIDVDVHLARPSTATNLPAVAGHIIGNLILPGDPDDGATTYGATTYGGIVVDGTECVITGATYVPDATAGPDRAVGR